MTPPFWRLTFNNTSTKNYFKRKNIPKFKQDCLSFEQGKKKKKEGRV